MGINDEWVPTPKSEAEQAPRGLDLTCTGMQTLLLEVLSPSPNYGSRNMRCKSAPHLWMVIALYDQRTYPRTASTT